MPRVRRHGAIYGAVRRALYVPSLHSELSAVQCRGLLLWPLETGQPELNPLQA
jgi:hypothetical protein